MQPDLTPDQLLRRLEHARTLDDLQASLRNILGQPATEATPESRGIEPPAELADDPGTAVPG